MKRLVVLVAVVTVALLAPLAAKAHPLGNFTINTFSRVQVSGDRVYVRYVLDMAEIPTFQAGHIDARAYATRLAAGAHLTVNGQAARLVATKHALAHPKGAGGLRTTRLEVILRGPAIHGAGRIGYHDGNYANRIGWHEIVFGADAKSRSDELRAYPKDLLSSPLNVRTAAATVAPTSDPPPGLTHGKALQAPDRVADSGFASLIVHDHLSTGFVALSLLIAMFWGAAHALSPGHGKSIVAAYLVGSRGTARHAVFLGLTVTVTHTIGVFALGLVTLSLSAFIVPDQLYPWLNLVSALLIVCVGLSVLRWRVREWRKGVPASDHSHHHDHHHGHGHGHHHHDRALSRRSLLGIGISGGIIPCPTALVVLLAAISLHRVGYGLVLIVAFSVGLAAAMTAIGILAVSAKRVFNRVDFNGGLIRFLPAVSAVVVLGLGLAMTVRAPPPRRLMFGLDDWVAHFSDGATLLVICGVAVLLGLRHATDPDHLAAVTTLIASGQERTKRAAARLGLIWGLGHGTSLFLFGLPIVLFKAYLPEPVQQGAEASVGVAIVALAIWLLVRWRRGAFHLHAHAHPGGRHMHLHDHSKSHRHSVRTRSPLQAYGIGLVHGMGGSAGVGILLLAAIHNRGVAVAALALFALFTAVSMSLLSTGFGLTLSSDAARRSFNRLAPALGAGSLLFGIWYALGALTIAPYYF